MNIGMKETIGTVDSSPMSPAAQPHWNTMTITPYAAPMLSRLRTTAFSGTSTDRKTSISRTNDIASTAAINTGSRSLTRAPTSAKFAV